MVIIAQLDNLSVKICVCCNVNSIQMRSILKPKIYEVLLSDELIWCFDVIKY